MPRPHLWLALLAGLVVTGAAASGAVAAQPSVKATVVGDSVSASITYVASAEALLETRGVSSHLDLKVCRRLVHPAARASEARDH